MRNDVFGTFKKRDIDDGYNKFNRKYRTLGQGEDWATGWWENIAPQPIFIRDKKHLKEVCEKYGVMAVALMKPKSQGKGYEMSV